MVSVSEDLVDTAARAVVRGSLLFHLDLAQLLALDALPAGVEAGGWAVDVGPEGYEVTFVTADLARETYAVTFAADGAPIGERRRGRPAPRLAALAAARQTALARAPIAEGWTVVVLPPAAGSAPAEPLQGYLLQRGSGPGDVPLDGHTRLALSADGRRVLGAEAVASTRVPSEVLVYFSLKQGVALEVVTPASGARWRVDGESLSRL